MSADSERAHSHLRLLQGEVAIHIGTRTQGDAQRALLCGRNVHETSGTMKSHGGWARRLLAGCGLLLAASSARADMTVLAEKPINLLGRVTSSGHAAVYLDHVYADGYTHLRHCVAGERGVVLSRYVGFGGYDWLAVDVLSYLYAVDTPEQIPSHATADEVTALRARYRDTYGAKLPAGVVAGDEQWRELVGSAYRRRTIAVRLHTTPEEDGRVVLWLNGSGNRSHFNLFWHNCADFAGSVVSVALGEPVHRSYVADASMMTPKQVVHRMQQLSREDSSLALTAYVIPQVPGDIRRSGHMYGVTEAL